MHCFDFSKFYNDFSFQKVHLFKTKNIKTAEKRALLVDRGSFFTTYWAVKHVSCTSRLYCKHYFFCVNLTGSRIRAFVFFIVMLKNFF